MKNLILGLLLCMSINSYSQCLGSENEFRDYFKKNIRSLDPIEGIWNVSHTIKKYVKGDLKSSSTDDSDRWAIIKDGSKYYACFMDEPGVSVISFTNTSNSGTFKYQEYRRYSTTAYLVNESTLNYKYEYNYSDVRNHYLRGQAKLGYRLSEDELRIIINWTKLINQYSLHKVFPKEEDYNHHEAKSGTGFGISSNGIIVTNYHVIEGSTSIHVKGVNSNFTNNFQAKVLLTDKNNDLAIIQISDNRFKTLGTVPFNIKKDLASVGESIFVLGYPLIATMGDELKLTNGIISSRTGFQGDITTYQISAPVQPGNSGGPLFDSNGNLIGIISSKHTGAENASYAIKSNYLYNLIDLLETPINIQKENNLIGKSLPQQVELIRKYVYIIDVE